MKLRNKKTGKIMDFGYLQSDHIAQLVLTTYEDDKPEMKDYNSLSELNEEWEDYLEPKEYWSITDDVFVHPHIVNCDSWVDDRRKQIGNYFETKEEAEKAVEKLKAWKRLKDKGFRFSKWTIPEEPKTTHIKLVLYAEMDAPDSPYDLDLLFGGEE